MLLANDKFHKISGRVSKLKKNIKNTRRTQFFMLVISIFTKKNIGSAPLYFATTNYQIAERLNILLQRLVDLGMIKYFNVKAFRMLQKNFASTNGASSYVSTGADYIDVNSITLTELTFILIVILIGYVLSVTVFVVELIVQRYS